MRKWVGDEEQRFEMLLFIQFKDFDDSKVEWGVGTQHPVASLASLASAILLEGVWTWRADGFGETWQVFDTIYNKMVVTERDRKGSEVFRFLTQAELHSAQGSLAKPSPASYLVSHHQAITQHCQPAS
jgi:hypothetical protein